ncbi:simple sugar transport system permease protein [Nocardia transvalensis]|uniref:Simple sugar transport system permease protein n=1 Tax=Nocardia transvalensis TaxID=37333 RepID=A0A7W9UKK8_9NOCA|nr:ABC transporter permease [Nocardia transvalensis]MBB5916576.1 simple sugar transport system permease protein [Nocardia transvalensis]
MSEPRPATPAETRRFSDRLRIGRIDRLRVADLVAAVALTAVATTVLFAAVGHDPLLVYRTMLRGAFAGAGLVTTVQQAIPVIGLALALSFSFRAGQFNLGGAGQFVGGGLAGAVVAPAAPGPGLLAVIAALAAAALAGALLSSASAVLYTRLAAPVFATSLLLNYPVVSITSYLIKAVLRDPATSRDASRLIPRDRRIPAIAAADSPAGRILDDRFGRNHLLTLLGAGVNWSLLVVAAVFAGCVFVNTRLPIGYETKLLGLNPHLAEAVGVRTSRAVVLNMATGGAIAGLMGALVVLGSHYRLIDGALDGSGYPITALLVALLARSRPGPVLLIGFLFTALGVGGQEIEREFGLSAYVSTVVQALVVFLVTIKPTPRFLARRWGARR